jgi:hypothetical protein
MAPITRDCPHYHYCAFAAQVGALALSSIDMDPFLLWLAVSTDRQELSIATATGGYRIKLRT